MKYIQGDLLKAACEGKFDFIVHGCNCWNTMGAGIAQQIKMIFPEAFEADQRTKRGDICKLGHCLYVPILNEKFYFTVVNAYTQYDFGFKGEKAPVDYKAIRYCMVDLKINCAGKRIGMPLIGCGLAGGDWNAVERIIEEELQHEDVTIMYLEEGFRHI